VQRLAEALGLGARLAAVERTVKELGAANARLEAEARPRPAARGPGERGVRLAQKMEVDPCIPVGIQL
jgi:hypothetical protein